MQIIKHLITFFLVVAFPALAIDSGTIEIFSDTVLNSNLVIPEGTTYIIRPGVTLSFDGYWGIQVRGQLKVQGRADAPVIFKAADWNKKNGVVAWRGVDVLGKEAVVSLKHCRVEGAYRNLLWGASPQIDSCTFVGNYYGLFCMDNAAPMIRGTLFNKNRIAVMVDGAAPVLHDVVIRENQLGLQCASGCAVITGSTSIDGNENDRRTESFSDRKIPKPRQLWDALLQMY